MLTSGPLGKPSPPDRSPSFWSFPIPRLPVLRRQCLNYTAPAPKVNQQARLSDHGVRLTLVARMGRCEISHSRASVGSQTRFFAFGVPVLARLREVVRGRTTHVSPKSWSHTGLWHYVMLHLI